MWVFSCISLAAEISKHEHRQTPQLSEEGYLRKCYLYLVNGVNDNYNVAMVTCGKPL